MDALLNRISEQVIGAAIEVHRHLGPGLLESAYQTCLAHEMALRELAFECEVPLPVSYKGARLDCGYRMDFVVEQRIVVELKAVQDIAPIHQQQLLSYLRLTQLPLGLLMNFHAPKLLDGLHRIINTQP